MDQDHSERIRQRAHQIWESEGRPEGRDAEHWSRAEQELRDRMPADGENTATDDAAAKPSARTPAVKRGKKARAEQPVPHLHDGP